MRVLRKCFGVAGVAAMFSVSTLGQMDTVMVPADVPPVEGNLNGAVQAAISEGKLSSTVFCLEPDGNYVLTGTISVPAGSHLRIIGPTPGTTQATAPPQIRWTSDDSVNTLFNFRCFGNITLKNVWLLYAKTNGWQSFSSLQIEDSPDSIGGQHGNFEGVIFDYAGISANGSGAVSVAARHFRGLFKNCYFRNCTDLHFRYYGRAVSFPFASTGWHIDSLRFDNCTFANMGYTYMQEGGEYADFVWFNHCTFLNVVMYTLESGWWHWLNVSNSVFVNTYMLGDSPYERWSTLPYPVGGTINIDGISSFDFAVPFTEAERHILFTHSSYAVEQWLRDYMASGYDGRLDAAWYPRDQWPVPQPMMSEKTKAFFHVKAVWPYVSMGPLYDSTDPGFVLAPTNVSGIKSFLYFKLTSSEDTVWAYNPEDDLNGVWPMKEDLSYTNPTLLTAGFGEFPLGDLYHWFPDRYAEWKEQEAAEHDWIMAWLSGGRDPNGAGEQLGMPVPARFELSQNYPNPFNSKTVFGSRLRVAGQVRLVLYDILGREVAVLVNERRAAGSYQDSFDAAGLASGVYIYRLTAGSFVQSRTMVLLR